MICITIGLAGLSALTGYMLMFGHDLRRAEPRISVSIIDPLPVDQPVPAEHPAVPRAGTDEPDRSSSDLGAVEPSMIVYGTASAADPMPVIAEPMRRNVEGPSDAPRLTDDLVPDATAALDRATAEANAGLAAGLHKTAAPLSIPQDTALQDIAEARHKRRAGSGIKFPTFSIGVFR